MGAHTFLWWDGQRAGGTEHKTWRAIAGGSLDPRVGSKHQIPLAASHLSHSWDLCDIHFILRPQGNIKHLHCHWDPSFSSWTKTVRGIGELVYYMLGLSMVR